MELLPCPFCGGEAYIVQVGTPRYSTIYECGSCSCRLETGETFNHGSRWNERASPASAPEGWKPLTDVQWMNIVNLNHAWENVDKEEAINEVVKLVEAKCKANNVNLRSSLDNVQSMCEESLAPDVYEMWLQVKAALITTRKSLSVAPTPPVQDDKDKIIASLQAKIGALMLEYCPEEMTPEQMRDREDHQQAEPQRSLLRRQTIANGRQHRLSGCLSNGQKPAEAESNSTC